MTEAFTHGTRNGYNRHGCRCTECRHAQADYVRDYRHSRPLPKSATATEERHANRDRAFPTTGRGISDLPLPQPPGKPFVRQPDRHYHTWRVAEPNGPTATGTCECGAEKVFPTAYSGDREWKFGSRHMGRTI